MSTNIGKCSTAARQPQEVILKLRSIVYISYIQSIGGVGTCHCGGWSALHHIIACYSLGDQCKIEHSIVLAAKQVSIGGA